MIEDVKYNYIKNLITQYDIIFKDRAQELSPLKKIHKNTHHKITTLNKTKISKNRDILKKIIDHYINNELNITQNKQYRRKYKYMLHSSFSQLEPRHFINTYENMHDDLELLLHELRTSKSITDAIYCDCYEYDIASTILYLMCMYTIPISEMYKDVYGTYSVNKLKKLIDSLQDVHNICIELSGMVDYYTNVDEHQYWRIRIIEPINHMRDAYGKYLDKLSDRFTDISDMRINMIDKKFKKFITHDKEHNYMTHDNNKSTKYPIRKLGKHCQYMHYDPNKDKNEIYWIDKNMKNPLKKISSLCYQSGIILNINAASNQYGGKHPPHIGHKNGFEIDFDVKYEHTDGEYKKIPNLKVNEKQSGYDALALIIAVQSLYINKCCKIIYYDEENIKTAIKYMCDSDYSSYPNIDGFYKRHGDTHRTHIHTSFKPLEENSMPSNENIVGIDPKLLYSIREGALMRDKNEEFKEQFFDNNDSDTKLWKKWRERSYDNVDDFNSEPKPNADPPLLPIWHPQT